MERLFVSSGIGESRVDRDRQLEGAEVAMTTDMVWKCEQWFGGEIHEQRVFRSEEQARKFAKEIMSTAPDMVLRIEAMPIQNVWN